MFLFGGAMSIGLCLWQTGAASWLAVHWLTLFQGAHWLVFVMGIAAFVLVMTNFIMNVAAIAISMPVALVMAPYLGVAPEVILFASLVVAGMPFLLLVGAAPNAIAYASGQFTTEGVLCHGSPGQRPASGGFGHLRVAYLAADGDAGGGDVGRGSRTLATREVIGLSVRILTTYGTEAWAGAPPDTIPRDLTTSPTAGWRYPGN